MNEPRQSWVRCLSGAFSGAVVRGSQGSSTEPDLAIVVQGYTHRIPGQPQILGGLLYLIRGATFVQSSTQQNAGQLCPEQSICDRFTGGVALAARSAVRF